MMFYRLGKNEKNLRGGIASTLLPLLPRINCWDVLEKKKEWDVSYKGDSRATEDPNPNPLIHLIWAFNVLKLVIVLSRQV